MICPNCGGDYADWAQRCPYCGSVNEAADERVYLEHLEEVRKRLDHVDEEAEETYRENVSRTGSAFLLIGLIVMALAAMAAIAWFAVGKTMDRVYEKKANEELAWEREEYPMLDELYEKGDFDAILAEHERLISSPHGLYSWPHYYVVIEYYDSYKKCNAVTEALRAGQTIDSSDLALGLYGGLTLHYNGTEERIRQLRSSNDANNGGYGLTEADAEMVRSYRAAGDEMFEALGWDSGQVQELYEKCRDKESDYIRIAPCFDAAKEMTR